MGSGGKPRWKWLSSFYRLSPASTTASPLAPTEPPREFICPISGRLMADPVILPSGQTFERGCPQAFKDLSVFPPGAGAGGADLLIPNMALKTAIHSWCDARGCERPQPIDPAAALHLVRGVPSPSSSATSCFTPNTTPSASSSSSSDIFCCDSQSPIKSASSSGSSPLEEQILAGLRNHRIPPQGTALLLLRSATRDGSGDARAALCTPKLLAALRPTLLCRQPTFQSHAAASLVNLSLHPPNRASIVRAGLVPALVDVLKCGGLDAQNHAAAALFSLCVDDDNKAAVGALGALPPLLHLLSRPSGNAGLRRDAAMALYHLSTTGTNRSKLVKLGAVRTLLGLATKAVLLPEDSTLPGLALMILCRMAASVEVRAAMMDAGAVEALVRLLRTAPPPTRSDAPGEARREHCVAALYWMSRGSLRFRGLAKSAGAEAALRAVVEQEEAAAEGEGEDAAENWKWRRTREMARRALRAAVGDEVGVGEAAYGG